MVYEWTHILKAFAYHKIAPSMEDFSWNGGQTSNMVAPCHGELYHLKGWLSKLPLPWRTLADTVAEPQTWLPQTWKLYHHWGWLSKLPLPWRTLADAVVEPQTKFCPFMWRTLLLQWWLQKYAPYMEDFTIIFDRSFSGFSQCESCCDEQTSWLCKHTYNHI